MLAKLRNALDTRTIWMWHCFSGLLVNCVGWVFRLYWWSLRYWEKIQQRLEREINHRASPYDKKNKGHASKQPNRKENDWRFQPTNSQVSWRFPSQNPGMGLRHPQHGPQHSWWVGCIGRWTFVGRGPDTCPTWCGGLVWVAWFWVRMKMSWKETVTYWIAPLVFMVTSYTHWICFLRSCSGDLPRNEEMSWHFFERHVFWRPCFICRWGRASKIHMWWSNVQCAFDRSSRSVCSCFFSDNPAYQWTMMPQVLWCRQTSLKPIIDSKKTDDHNISPSSLQK